MKRACHILILVAAISVAFNLHADTVPSTSVLLPGINIESMRERLDELDLQPLEGIWYYPNEEMTLGIERHQGEHNIGYRIILLDAKDITLEPGTIIGYIATSATDNKYKLWIYSQRNKVSLFKPLECVATLNNQATTLIFDPPHWKLKIRVNFARFLPTLFRGISIVPEKVEEKLPIGFRKIYPEGGDGNPFNRIRYL